MSLLAAAQGGDEDAFARLVAGHRHELHVYCYRMLGSVEDAKDAVQETILAAWRGLAGFQQRASLRSWLYRIATNCCLRMSDKRPKRIVSWDHGPSRKPGDDLGTPVTEPIWLQPWPDDVSTIDPECADPATSYGRKESVGLAYVAALQRLPANQRAVLILREVLAFSAAEVAEQLGTSTQSVNSAMQRAKANLAQPVSVDEPRVDGLDAGQREAMDAFVSAFERADVPALVRLLAEDVRFTMPPLPAWFDGVADVTGFFAQRVFATPWRVTRVGFNGRPAMACYQGIEGEFRLGTLTIPHFRDGRVVWIASFLDPLLLARLGLPPRL
ncbi:RNA polymerase subunit sigma-70 [Stackebrandtia nassauensis]|uniref:RNA polymerase, sigma-24 subunit, ECF subfamily n=1 Tax=Stackebrandtia nassauensis (strain DSM 44728 / CIP 108903 / NRRL B-16338 / NBRC 102104 / LLR-40K-21) TaxID=446470 RepID=D3PY31_STANL|nr:RNA polymerase subunit sigma-70 [Stackebrandtia nassauensis]ADD45360.1 RNA polymerase, sigma-24 subunit, ECF subfamily [Stackebrandtia nassauensis DSM 44728]